MSGKQFAACLQKHWSWALLAAGVLIGAAMDWSWLCDPAGKPYSQRYGLKARRVIFFLLGVVLIAAAVLGVIRMAK